MAVGCEATNSDATPSSYVVYDCFAAVVIHRISCIIMCCRSVCLLRFGVVCQNC